MDTNQYLELGLDSHSVPHKVHDILTVWTLCHNDKLSSHHVVLGLILFWRQDIFLKQAQLRTLTISAADLFANKRVHRWYAEEEI